MAGSSPPPRIPLPRGWPWRVRSAVIHAISLAHFSLTSTRSWSANNWNVRIRLKTENDRLRQELALLQEEMRIKDARRLVIPYRRERFRRELSLFVTWYNRDRPSEALDGRTPDEIYHGFPPALSFALPGRAGMTTAP